MNTINTINIENQVKKHIYGKPQEAIVTYPPGFSSVAFDEINFIFNNLWLPQKITPEVTTNKNLIYIKNIHTVSLIELMMRAKCISDIKLVIFNGKCANKETFQKKCSNVNWNLYINNQISLKLKVDSVASKAFHETGLKEILKKILSDKIKEIVQGENTQETTCLHADLYKDRLTLSLSIAGDPLYKRGFKEILNASAPLREDAAACCIEKCLQLGSKLNHSFSPDTIFLPFSGTGTFAFEYLLKTFTISPALLRKNYALQKLPFFRKSNFEFLLKKATEHCNLAVQEKLQNKLRMICNDNSNKANSVFINNLIAFQKSINENQIFLPENLFVHTENQTVPYLEENMFMLKFEKVLCNENNNYQNLFIAMNPPYGLRLGKEANTINLYKKISNYLNSLSKTAKNHNKHILGFILCPSEEAWSAFVNQLQNFKCDTYHFTHGGKDIRVCQFYF